MLVEKIAQTYWRLAVAAWHEGDAFEKGKPFTSAPMYSITRYQTTINRQLFQAMNQLERLQRLRKGDNVPAPLNLQMLGDVPGITDGDGVDR